MAVMTRNDFGLLTQDLGSKLAIRYGQNDELEADRFGACICLAPAIAQKRQIVGTRC